MTYQIPGYTILRELSRGGMAAVYLAVQDALQREVALKVLAQPLGSDADIVERFRREARTAANLNHRNIVNVYDVGSHEDIVFLSMELLRGEDLDARVQRGISVDQAIGIVSDVARALQHAHRHGVVHRDIKPQNIMFREDGTTVLTDFGIAKMAGVPELTQTGSTIGTPHYMSPEQVRGTQVDGRSDLYSLGVVFYRMLAGKPPFDGTTLVTVAFKHVTEPPPPLPARFEALQPIIDGLMAKAPEARYQSADQVIAALESVRGTPAGRATVPRPGTVTPETERTLTPVTAPRTASPASSKSRASFGETLRRIWVAISGVKPANKGASGASPTISGSGSTKHLEIIVDPHATGATPPPPPASLRTRTAPSIERTIPLPPPPTDGAADTLERTFIATQPFRPPPRPSEPDPSTAAPGRHDIPPIDAGDFTQVFAPEKWAPPPDPAVSDGGASVLDHDGTRLVPLPGSPAGSTALPVALSITRSSDPGRHGSRVACDHFPFTIGRADIADLSLPSDRALSRIHVSIEREESGFVIRDLSTNGVYINGRHIKGVSEPLVFGATIVLSKDTTLDFVADLPALPDLSGRVLNERYVLGERIHQGMKSATYAARDRRLPRRLAVKVFAPSLLQLAHYRSEFLRQAELAAQLQHPSVCTVLDFGEAKIADLADLGEVSFLCLEYMEGGNLAGRLETEPLPPLEIVVTWIELLSDALDHAHRNGIVHGDLKPACIVFDRDGRPYLTDFALGSSRDTEPAAAVLGTPAYMAPERWAGNAASELTDQYSLGVLAYLVVTGTRPHEGQADPDVRQRNFRRGPPAAHEEARRAGRDDVRPSLSAVLDKALSVAPADRYASVREFAQAFARAVRQPGRRHDQPRIFISYQRESSAGWAVLFAHRLKTEHDLSIFVDTLAKDGAPTIPDRIRQEIAECDVFVCFLAPNTLASTWVRQEIEIAVQERKPMVPIYHEDFRTSDEERRQDDTIRHLLAYDAVQLLDRRNIHVEHSITDLVDRIRKFVT